MTKIERVDAVLQGKEPDRPPVCLWYHFGHQHLSGEKFAAIALDFFTYYDFDFLKLMNDYFYPMPEGYEEVATGRDLLKLPRFEPERSEWKEQLKAIRILSKALKGQAYLIDTVFDPWQSLQRNVCGEHLPHLAKAYPKELTKALNIVADNLIDYCRKSIQSGAQGIFMSVLASKEHVDRKTYLNFIKPAAMKVFESIKSLAPMNVAHIHGTQIYTNDVLDFPVPILSWEDRLPKNPSLEEMKKRFPGVVMGGIDNTIVTRHTPAFIKRNVLEGIQMGGKSRFILANGCSIPSWMSSKVLKMIVETAKKPPA
jgi:uroporphyrinogen decarboxylase